MLKLLSGTFAIGCGVMVHELEDDEYYHLLVLEEKHTGNAYVEIHGKPYYKEDLGN